MSPQQHGAVAGRAVPGTGNTAADEPQPRADLGDPDNDPIGTWRIHPWAPERPVPWRRQYDLGVPRAVKVGHLVWRLVDPEGRAARDLPLHLGAGDLADWPITPTVVVGAAARLHYRRTRGGPAPAITLRSTLPEDEDESPFRERTTR